MTSVDSNFNFLCGRPHGAGPPPPVHMRPHGPDHLPLRVDVINGWPQTCSNIHCDSCEILTQAFNQYIATTISFTKWIRPCFQNRTKTSLWRSFKSYRSLNLYK